MSSPPPSATPPWTALSGLAQELKACADAGHIMAALAFAYVCLDTMAYLAMPESRVEQTADDFIAWVDTYLTAHVLQPYQYRGLDLYAARCGVLHTFGAEARLHRKDPAIPLFSYTDGGAHTLDATKAPRTVQLGIRSLVNDIVGATYKFLKACENDPALRARVEPRLATLLQTLPIQP